MTAIFYEFEYLNQESLLLKIQGELAEEDDVVMTDKDHHRRYQVYAVR